MRLPLPRRSPISHLIETIELAPTSDRLVLRLLLFIGIGTGIFLLLSFNESAMRLVPGHGGTLTEGIVGTPRFVNPALAITRADRDATALVYSGLMRLAPDGELVPELAESITVSDDGLTYNIVLRRDARFHDGTPLTSRDVAFTIQLIQDPDLKSPLRGNWSDVTVEVIGEYELNVVLSEPYAPFIENFTLGIMPQHVWSELPIEQLPFSQHNTAPIGSGPFEIARVQRDSAGLIDGYTLRPADEHWSDPRLASIELRFFENEDTLAEAFADGAIMSTTHLPPQVAASLPRETAHIIEEPLPRIFGLFLNQNRSPALRDAAARAALSAAIDREAVIDIALAGFGVPTTRPVLFPTSTVPLAATSTPEIATSSATATLPQLARAEELLREGGWAMNDVGVWEKRIDGQDVELAFTISTSNEPLFTTVAEEVAAQYRALGVEVTLEQYEQSGLVQSVIRTRDFESLLFGIDLNRAQDLYPFWHSSQQNDPGLNIAQYANITVDDLLEKARAEQDRSARIATTLEAAAIITEEAPAIFLFVPTLTYAVDPVLVIPPIANLGTPSDRFMNAADWYTRTSRVWPIFASDE